MNAREQLIEWLSDAHAMEKGIIESLKRHSDEAKQFPEIQAELDAHRVATERHAADVKGCLDRLGAEPSVIKSSVAKAGGVVAGLAARITTDTLVKNALADFSTEHFEIACYQSLIAAAEELGEADVADVCEGILEDEQEMAALLEERIPEITLIHLQSLRTA